MSKLLDVLTGVTSNEATKETKAASALKVKKHKELKVEMATVLSPELEKLVQSDFKTSKLVVKAEGAEYSAFKALVRECEKAGVFKDSKLLRLVQTSVSFLFDSETIAARRNTMLSNTAKVAYGGSVGRESDNTKRAVAGKGWSAVLEVLEAVSSIRTYHTVITAAKPEGLKAKPKSEEEKRIAKEKKEKEAKAAKKESEALTGTVTSHEDAFLVAIQALDVCEKFLLPGTNAREIAALHVLLSYFNGESSQEVKKQKVG